MKEESGQDIKGGVKERTDSIHRQKAHRVCAQSSARDARVRLLVRIAGWKLWTVIHEPAALPLKFTASDYLSAKCCAVEVAHNAHTVSGILPEFRPAKPQVGAKNLPSPRAVIAAPKTTD